MKSDNFKSISCRTFLLVSGLLVFFNLSFFPGNILSWDVFGYYMYLPMIFIYNNWGLQNIDIVHDLINTYKSSSTLYQAYPTETGSWLMRYSMGMAIFYFPFFVIGHFLALLMDFSADGFSAPYQTAILYGGIVYSIVGFYFLRKVLLNFYSERITAVTLIIIYLGTNYFFHSGFQGQNAMSHNVLFTMYSIILWLTIKWHISYNRSYMVLLALCCSLTILARPSEIVCLLIPFFWGVDTFKSLKSKIQIIFEDKLALAMSLLFVISVAMPQLLYWKIITGKFLFNSMYNNPGEGFNFLYPYIIEVLVSFRKGWLIYTPMVVFAIAGIFLLFKQKSVFKIPVAAYFVFNLYLVSSWSCWWYAESFSSRALVQSYAMLALPMAAFLHWTFNKSGVVFKACLAVICMLVALNIFQTWQFLNNIIHPSRMTQQAYWAVFGKTSRPPGLDDKLLIDRPNANGDTIEISRYLNKFTASEEFENESGNNSIYAFSGRKSYKLTRPDEYSPTVKLKYRDITREDHVKIKVSAMVYLAGEHSSGELVARFDHKGDLYGIKSVSVNSGQVNIGKWNRISFVYLTPVIRMPNDHFKVYFTNKGKDPVYVDDLKIVFWEPKNGVEE